MKQETYDWIWQEVVVKQIDNILNKYKRNNVYICDFQLRYTEEKPYLQTKKIIQEKYETIRDNLKRICYAGDDIRKHSLDQHKIAACFCKAFVDTKVFVFKYNENTPDDMLLVNYYLAHHVSMEIISLYLEASYIKRINEDKSLLESFYSTEGLITPKSKHGEYHDVSVTTIALNDFYNVEFNLLSYAREMFWLEYYNRQVIENKISPPIDLISVD